MILSLLWTKLQILRWPQGHSVNPDRWQRVSDQVIAAFADRFARVEPRRAAAGFVTGLLAGLEIKTSWQLAEQAGHTGPDKMQRLLYRAAWDADAVRGRRAAGCRGLTR